MDELIYNEYDCTITIQELYSEEPLISIYKNALGHVTFELTNGEVCAVLEIQDVKSLINYLQEIVHESK